MSWQVKTLGEVCEINPRLSRDHGLADDTLVSFVPMAAVDEVSGVVRDKQQRAFGQVKKGYTSFRDGDVLFAKITPCMENGKAAIASDLVSGVGFGSTEFHVLRPRSGVLPEWIYYFVRQEPFRLEAKRNFTGTAGQQRVPTTFLANCRIPVPPVEDQRRIVDLLSRAEGIVRLRREARKKAQQIIPALFLDIFGDPVTNPKGWPTATLGEHIDLLTGFPFKSSEFVQADDAVRLCRGANVLPQCIDWFDVRYWPRRRMHEVERYLLCEGDIVLAMDRPWISAGLKVARMTRSDAPALLVQRVARIRPKGALLPEYLYSLLCHHSFTAHCNAVKTETLVPHISPHDIRSFPVVLAPIADQRRFAALVERTQAVKTQQASALTNAESAFSALLTRAFSESIQQESGESSQMEAVA